MSTRSNITTTNHPPHSPSELPRTHKEAKALGLPHYFTGKPCKRGHTAPRYASNRKCSICNGDQARQWSAQNPEKARNSKKNPERTAATYGKSRAVERAPGCIPEDFDLEATIPFYEKARRLTRETGIPHHVDHIQALTLGGLHEARNLQVIPAKENRRKGSVERRLAVALGRPRVPSSLLAQARRYIPQEVLDAILQCRRAA